VSERDDEKKSAADTVKPGTGEVGAQSTTSAALEAGGQNVPAGPRGGRTQLEVVDVRKGMFGVHGSGDTSGFGGLVSTVAMPPASERPYGGWFDEVVDVLVELLEGEGIDPDAAIEKVVVDRGEVTFYVRREDLLPSRPPLGATRTCGFSSAAASPACPTPTTPGPSCPPSNTSCPSPTAAGSGSR